jgi:hypothetical protein
MNEWVTVRKGERVIILRGRLTAQIYIRSPDVDLETSDVQQKHCSSVSQSLRKNPMLEVLTYIGTSDVSALLIGVGTAGTSARAELAR